ncbi:unnamed protein product [Coregonus sp. 'balchen']|nr:unnamed protein product [Coregonus sp. 'balchen']
MEHNCRPQITKIFSWSNGQERFGNMTRVYYREAMGAFIVFDVTRPSTFEAITKWKEDLDSKLMLTNKEENTNINEAANFLVKHIMATENDILKSVIPDTISPKLDDSQPGTCSACYKP